MFVLSWSAKKAAALHHHISAVTPRLAHTRKKSDLISSVSTWHSELSGRAEENHRAAVALPPLRLAPVASRVVLRHRHYGVAVTRGQVPGVRSRTQVRFVPEPPVAPHNAGVGLHGTEQQSTLPEVQRWPWRPHGDTDYKSLCRETDSVVIRGSARQGLSVSVRPECFSFFPCELPWDVTAWQTSAATPANQMIHINTYPYALRGYHSLSSSFGLQFGARDA